MAVAFRTGSATVTDSLAVANITPTLPTGWQADDFMSMMVVSDNPAVTLTTGPTGWTLMETPTPQDEAVWFWWRVAQAGDTAQQATFNLGSTMRAVTAAWTGADTTSPVDDSAPYTAGAATTHPFTEVVPTVSDALLVGQGAFDGSGAGRTLTQPGSMTQRHHINTIDGARYLVCCLADEQLSASGGTGTRTFTASESQEVMGAMWAVKPASGVVWPPEGSDNAPERLRVVRSNVRLA